MVVSKSEDTEQLIEPFISGNEYKVFFFYIYESVKGAVLLFLRINEIKN